MARSSGPARRGAGIERAAFLVDSRAELATFRLTRTVVSRVSPANPLSPATRLVDRRPSGSDTDPHDGKIVPESHRFELDPN
jgi:hypothetical protein